MNTRAASLLCAFGASAFGFAACETGPPPLYHWSSYERSSRRLLEDPDGINLVEEIRALSGEIEKDLLEGRRVAPGVHAHLGYLYYLSGNPASAELEFEAEKAAFPESAPFVDGLVRRMKR